MKKRMTVAVAALAGSALLPAAPATAQETCTLVDAPSCTVDMTVYLEVNALAYLEVEQEVHFDVTAASYDQGRATSDGHWLFVFANVEWSLSIHAETGSWGGPVDSNKPASDLLWTMGAELFPIGTDEEAGFVTSDVPGQHARSVWYEVLLDWEEDPPGEYELGVVFTLSAA